MAQSTSDPRPQADDAQDRLLVWELAAARVARPAATRLVVEIAKAPCKAEKPWGMRTHRSNHFARDVLMVQPLLTLPEAGLSPDWSPISYGYLEDNPRLQS